jgi:hypothetical protein
VLLRHRCLVVLSYAYALSYSQVDALFLVGSIITVLPDDKWEWRVVSMFIVVAQSGAPSRLHHWILTVGVKPSKSLAKLRQVFPPLFPVCAQPGFCRALLMSYMFAQGALPSL